MKDEIELDGKKYVLKDSIKEDNKSSGIMDSANVSMFINIDDECFDGDLIRIKKPNFVFKKSFSEDDKDITDKVFYSFDKEVLITPNKTKISSEFIILARRVIALMSFSKPSKVKFMFYEGWNEKDKKFNVDYPVLLSDGSKGFILAPRIIND